MSEDEDMSNDLFTISLVSSAPMKIFGENTLASFRNLVCEEINLQGERRVALSETTFPA